MVRAGTRAAVLAALTLAALLAAPAAAMAHAVLLSTDPGDGAVVRRAPARISLGFDEKVFLKLGFVHVFSPSGARVDTGAPRYGSTDGAKVTVRLRGGLGDGTYTVGWRVISDDGHPVAGAFAFSIGARSATAATTAGAEGSPGSPVVGWLYGVVRWAGYAAFAALAGGLLLILACWPAGLAVRRARRLVYGSLTVLVAAAVGALLLEGPYDGGLALGSALRGGVLSATLSTGFGRAGLVRLILLGLVLPYLGWLFGRFPVSGRREKLILNACGGVLAIVLALTWAIVGHSSVGMQVPLAEAADAVHLLAMAAWGGGLLMLAAVALRGEPRHAAASRPLAAAVARFSPLALASVTALAATGAYQAWREVGSWAPLAGTSYGRLLLIKSAGLAVLAVFGAHARRVLAGQPPWRAFAWTVPARLRTGGPGQLRPGAVPVLTAAGGTRAWPAGDLAGVPAPAVGRAAAASGSPAVPPGRAAPRPGSPVAPPGPGMPAAPPGPDAPAAARAGPGGTASGAAPNGTASGAMPGGTANGTARGGTPHPATHGAPAPGHGGQRDPAATVARLRRGVLTETVLVAGVLAVAALLVNTAPPRTASAAASQRPAAAAPVPGGLAAPAVHHHSHIHITYQVSTAPLRGGGPGLRGTVRVTLTHSPSGVNGLYLAVLGTSGRPVRVRGVRVTFVPATGGPARAVKVIAAGAGNFIGNPLVLPHPGNWRATVTVRARDGGRAVAAATVTAR
jgi:copper transport protein